MRSLLNTERMQSFISSPYFAVVGASTSREKFGNIILRWYIKERLNVVPVHPRESKIEELTTVPSVANLEHPADTAISIITPPNVTLNILQECKKLGISRIWIQPGAEDEKVLAFCREAGLDQVITDECILEEGGLLLTTKLS